MGVTIAMTGSGSIGDIGVGWSVTEEATPVSPTDSSGGTGALDVGAHQNSDSRFVIDNNLTMTHPTLGDFSGLITDVGLDGSAVSFSAATYLSLLTVERTMATTGSQLLSQIIAGYVSAVTSQITVSYLATSDPLRTYPGWSGNVWLYLKALAVANRVELAISDNVLIVRDIGSTVYTITDSTPPRIRQNNNATGRSFDMVVVNPTLIPTLGTSLYNYSQNPSLVTLVTGWSSTLVGATLTSPGRFNNGGGGYGSWSYRALVATATGTEAARRVQVVHRVDVTSFPVGQPLFASVHVGGILKQSTYDLSIIRSQSYLILYARWSDGTISDSPRFTSKTPGGIRNTVGGGDLTLSTTLTHSDGIRTPFKKPLGATYVDLIVELASDPTDPNYALNNAEGAKVGDLLYVTNAMFTIGSSVPYADGSFAGWAWMGTANNSVSVFPISSSNDFYNAHADDNAIYSVPVGQSNTYFVNTDNYPTYLAQPVGQDVAPNLTGGYIVVDSQGLIVPNVSFTAAGGMVTVSIPDDALPGTIKIVLKGPLYDIVGFTGPYTLGYFDSTNIFVAALSIAGIGVTTSPVVLNFLTGANPDKVTNETASRVNSPFTIDYATAYNSGNWAAIDAAGPTITATFTVATHTLTGFGLTPGALVSYNDAVYRVVNVQIGETKSLVTVRWHTTIGAMDSAWSGQTLGAFDALWSGYSAGDIQIAPLRNT